MLSSFRNVIVMPPWSKKSQFFPSVPPQFSSKFNHQTRLKRVFPYMYHKHTGRVFVFSLLKNFVYSFTGSNSYQWCKEGSCSPSCYRGWHESHVHSIRFSAASPHTVLSGWRCYNGVESTHSQVLQRFDGCSQQTGWRSSGSYCSAKCKKA